MGWTLGLYFTPKSLELLLMEEILHHLIGSSSHYLQLFYIPGGAGSLRSTAFRGAEESFRKMMEAPISLGNFKTQTVSSPAFGEDVWPIKVRESGKKRCQMSHVNEFSRRTKSAKQYVFGEFEPKHRDRNRTSKPWQRFEAFHVSSPGCRTQKTKSQKITDRWKKTTKKIRSFKYFETRDVEPPMRKMQREGAQCLPI